jgi:hypothetical protein
MMSTYTVSVMSHLLHVLIMRPYTIVIGSQKSFDNGLFIGSALFIVSIAQAQHPFIAIRPYIGKDLVRVQRRFGGNTSEPFSMSAGNTPSNVKSRSTTYWFPLPAMIPATWVP